MSKKCGSCGDVKDYEFFTKDSSTVSGYACYCKGCAGLKNSEKYKKMASSHEWKLKQMLKSSRERASIKNMEHTLTLADLKELYPVDGMCPVFDIKLEWGHPKRTSPSLDRIDSTKGYTYDNCQIISNKANVIKNDATLEELELLVNYLKGI